MSTFTLSTIAQASGHSFVALPGKSGKVSNAAQRQADALDNSWVVTMVEIYSSLPHRKVATVVTGAQAS
jgi:hypothetical protein